MDVRSHERPRQAHHGLVALVVLLAIGMAGVSLVAAVAGGLLMACPAPPPAALPTWLLAGAASHAALMTGGFLGTMIGLERAVALGRPLAFSGPVLSALAAATMLEGHGALGAALLVPASAALVVASVAVMRRQAAWHTALLLLAAVAWLAGCLVHLGGAGTPIPFWFSFLVLTVAAERLEMTRLTRRARHARSQLILVVALMLSGAALATLPWALARLGPQLFGTSLILLALWLFRHDIARRTLHTEGLSQFMAVCLLLGYGWLAIAGLGWIGLGFGLRLRDLALHALALGFVGSMMMGHAPVILPALTRLRPRFGVAFYMPLAVLHASLVVRLCALPGDAIQRGVGAVLNAFALVLFVATLIGAIVVHRGRRRGALNAETS
jgi:hypothetical protein